MGARGKRSTNAPLKLPGSRSGERPKPPSDMTVAARRQWNIIVDSLPPSHFRPAEYPLLHSYCEAHALYLDSVKAIREEGAVVKISKMIFDPETGDEREVILKTKANPWVAIQTQVNNTKSQLATKLRIATNARVSTWKAAGEKVEAPSKSNREGLLFGEK